MLPPVHLDMDREDKIQTAPTECECRVNARALAQFGLFRNGIRMFIYVDPYVVKNAVASDESRCEVE